METVACLRSKCHLKQNLISRFPLQNKIHKQTILSDTRTGILGSIAGPCDFLPAGSDGPTNFKKSELLALLLCI